MDRVILYLRTTFLKALPVLPTCTELCKMKFPFCSKISFSMKSEQSSYRFWHSLAGLQILVKGWTPLRCFEQDTGKPRPFVREHRASALRTFTHSCKKEYMKQNRGEWILERKWNCRKNKLAFKGLRHQHHVWLCWAFFCWVFFFLRITCYENSSPTSILKAHKMYGSSVNLQGASFHIKNTEKRSN